MPQPSRNSRSANAGKTLPTTAASANPGMVLLQTAVILLAGWWVFAPAWHGGWLWDDALETVQNPILRAPGGLWKIWSGAAGPDYFPLKSTLQWVQWRLWRDQTFGYHLSSTALHLLGAVLLTRLFRKLGLRLAWLGGLLFAIHPVTVESVAWMAELKNTLSLPFLLLAMGAFLDYDERKQRADQVRAVLLFLAAMLCKSSVVMFPAILLLYVWWKRGRITRTDALASLPFFAVSLMLGLVTMWFQQTRAIGAIAIPVGGWTSRLAGSGLALGFYFSKCVLPVNLLPIYPRWTVNPPSPGQFLPWLVLGAFLAGLWLKRATWGRHLLFGGGCFLLNLVPVLGFITMSYQRITWVADHFVYLPLVGLIGLAVAGTGAAIARLPATLRPSAFGAVALMLGLLAWQSHRHAGNFRSEDRLWTYTLQRNQTAWMAHNNLGSSLLQAGQLTDALGRFETAARLNPEFAEAQINLGNVLLALGRVDEAIAHGENAVRIQPGSAEAHNNLANALDRAGRVAEALPHYVEAVRIKPDFLEAHYNYAVVLGHAKRWPEALQQYEEALRIRPDYAPARDALARLRAYLQTPHSS